MGAAIATIFFVSLSGTGIILLCWRWFKRQALVKSGQPLTPMWIILISGTVAICFSLEQLLPTMVHILGIPQTTSVVSATWPVLTILIVATLHNYELEYKKDNIAYCAQALFLFTLAVIVAFTQPLGTLNSLMTALYFLALAICCIALKTDFIRGDEPGKYLFTALAESVIGSALLTLAVMEIRNQSIVGLHLSPLLGGVLLLHSAFLIYNARRMMLTDPDQTLPPVEDEIF